MPEVSNGVLQAALQYASLGWRVVPLHSVRPDGACSCGHAECPAGSRGKHPRIKAWQKDASIDEDTICGWWEKWPDSNVGVALGRESGIVDIECDTEKAKREYLELFGRDPPVTPAFDAHRGPHRLFQYHPDLPAGAVLHIGDIEVRTGNDGKGAQSVFPPSRRGAIQYRWMSGCSPSECEVAPLPKEVLAKLWNLQGELNLTPPAGKSEAEWDRILKGVAEGTRNQDMTSACGLVLRRSSDIDDQQALRECFQIVRGLNANNKPPLTDKELQTIFKSILKLEQARRAGDNANTYLALTPEKQAEQATAKPTEPSSQTSLRCVIVRSDPPRYELHAPAFEKAESGCLILNAEQMNSGRSIRVQALRQAEYALPLAFVKRWEKPSGLYEQVVRAAEIREVPLEQKRHLLVAACFQEIMLKAEILKDAKEVLRDGSPCRLQDGGIVFSYNKVFEILHMGAHKIESGELSALLEKLEVSDHSRPRSQVGGGRVRLKVLSEEGLEQLTSMLEPPKSSKPGPG